MRNTNKYSSRFVNFALNIHLSKRWIELHRKICNAHWWKSDKSQELLFVNLKTANLKQLDEMCCLSQLGSDIRVQWIDINETAEDIESPEDKDQDWNKADMS